ncbi:GDSL-type esterase/lipase family protein [Actinoplanes aureus]|nr:GDSL-type esterase/lipase family protein [Actinoplanes aureus]
MMWARTAVVATVAVSAATGLYVAIGREDDPEQPPVAVESPQPSPSAAPALEALEVPSPAPAAVPWVGTWAVAVQPGGRPFDRQTLRQIVHTSIGGDSARVRLSNAYGTKPLTVSSVHVARRVRGSTVDPATNRPVTFGGATSVTIPAGGSAVSDPVDFVVPADSDIAVSAYLPSATGASTRHAVGTQHNYIAAGDQSAAAGLRRAKTHRSYHFLAGVDVQNAKATGSVVAFGASITDGVGSMFGANRRWPDLLSDRLRSSGRTIGVLNTGISGNRLTADTHGDSAAKRFDRDVLRQPGVRWVIISDDAINDLGKSAAPASELTGALRNLIDRAHDADIKVICSTLTPYRGAGYWTARGEQGRAAVNAFVRSRKSGCDAVLDQDRATRDPSAPTRFRPEYDSGDHLHPDTQGMRAIANAVNLGWFND